MASVTFKNISKRFGNVVAVNNLNLEVADGEFLVLLGPSGCGKTTTMRIVAGLETETEGEIFIGDHSWLASECTQWFCRPQAGSSAKKALLQCLAACACLQRGGWPNAVWAAE